MWPLLVYIVGEEFMSTQYFAFLYIQAQNVARLLWTSLPFQVFPATPEAPPYLLQLAITLRLLYTLWLLTVGKVVDLFRLPKPTLKQYLY